MLLQTGHLHAAWQVILDTEVLSSSDFTSPFIDILKPIRVLTISFDSLSFQKNVPDSTRYKK